VFPLLKPRRDEGHGQVQAGTVLDGSAHLGDAVQRGVVVAPVFVTSQQTIQVGQLLVPDVLSLHCDGDVALDIAAYGHPTSTGSHTSVAGGRARAAHLDVITTLVFAAHPTSLSSA